LVIHSSNLWVCQGNILNSKWVTQDKWAILNSKWECLNSKWAILNSKWVIQDKWAILNSKWECLSNIWVNKQDQSCTIQVLRTFGSSNHLCLTSSLIAISVTIHTSTIKKEDHVSFVFARNVEVMALFKKKEIRYAKRLKLKVIVIDQTSLSNLNYLSK